MGAQSIQVTPEPKVPEGITSRFDIDYLATWEWIASTGTYALHLFDTQETDELGKSHLCFRVERDGETLLETGDYFPGMGIAIDSDESAAGIIGFLAHYTEPPVEDADDEDLAPELLTFVHRAADDHYDFGAWCATLEEGSA